MFRFLMIFAAVAALIGPANAQAPIISGTLTPGHSLRVLDGNRRVLGDGGAARGSTTNGAGYLTELGITNTGTPFCINDALISGPYHQLCFGALSNNSGILSYTNYGGAPADPFTIKLNNATVLTGTATGVSLLGTPLATTAVSTDNSARIATTAFVQSLIAATPGAAMTRNASNAQLPDARNNLGLGAAFTNVSQPYSASHTVCANAGQSGCSTIGTESGYNLTLSGSGTVLTFNDSTTYDPNFAVQITNADDGNSGFPSFKQIVVPGINNGIGWFFLPPGATAYVYNTSGGNAWEAKWGKRWQWSNRTTTQTYYFVDPAHGTDTIGAGDGLTGAMVLGNISGTTLTISSVLDTNWSVPTPSYVNAAGAVSNTQITGPIAANPDGTGTYTVNNSQTLGGEQATVSGTINGAQFNLTFTSGGTQTVTYTGTGTDTASSVAQNLFWNALNNPTLIAAGFHFRRNGAVLSWNAPSGWTFGQSTAGGGVIALGTADVPITLTTGSSFRSMQGAKGFIENYVDFTGVAAESQMIAFQACGTTDSVTDHFSIHAWVGAQGGAGTQMMGCPDTPSSSLRDASSVPNDDEQLYYHIEQWQDLSFQNTAGRNCIVVNHNTNLTLLGNISFLGCGVSAIFDNGNSRIHDNGDDYVFGGGGALINVADEAKYTKNAGTIHFFNSMSFSLYTVGATSQSSVAIPANAFNLHGNTVTGQRFFFGTAGAFLTSTTPTNLTDIAWSNGTVTAHTAASHGITSGQFVLILGVTPSLYNGLFVTQSGTTGNTIVYNLSDNPGTASVIGTVSLQDPNGIIPGDRNGSYQGGASANTITPSFTPNGILVYQYPDNTANYNAFLSSAHLLYPGNSAQLQSDRITTLAAGAQFANTLVGTITSTQVGAIDTPLFKPGGASLVSAYGHYSNPTMLGSNSIVPGNLWAYSGQPITNTGFTGQIANAGTFLAGDCNNGSGNTPFANCYGFQAAVITNGNGITSGTVNNYGNLISSPTASAGSGGTINNYGLSVSVPSGSGAGTTVNYGINISGVGGSGGGGTTTNYAIYSLSTAPSVLGANLTLPTVTMTGAAPTVAAAQIGYGGTTVASTNCGSLAGAAGCIVVNVAGVTHYVPYY